MTSLYNHDITLVLFSWIIKDIIRKIILSLETGASLDRELLYFIVDKRISVSQNDCYWK